MQGSEVGREARPAVLEDGARARGWGDLRQRAIQGLPDAGEDGAACRLGRMKLEAAFAQAGRRQLGMDHVERRLFLGDEEDAAPTGEDRGDQVGDGL